MGADEKEKALKEIDFNSGNFTANGKEYFIDKQISAERFYKMQELSFDLGFGVSYADFFKNLNTLYEMLNKQNFVDCAVLTHNMMNGIAGLENREMPVLKYCTCFINTKGEDKRYWTEEMAEEKIKDWSEEGIDFKGFFGLCLTTIQDLRENYNNHFQATSQK